MIEIQTAPQVKHCPICSTELPISEFGICRARKDGRNLYCKSCIRDKVCAARRNNGEYLKMMKKRTREYYGAMKKKKVAVIYALKKPPTIDERVLEAIQKGARTQQEI